MNQRPDQARPTPRAGIMDIEAYVPGKSTAPAGVAKVYKLSSNENPLGAVAEGDRGRARGCRQARTSIPTARPRGCARRSPRCMA